MGGLYVDHSRDRDDGRAQQGSVAEDERAHGTGPQAYFLATSANSCGGVADAAADGNSGPGWTTEPCPGRNGKCHDEHRSQVEADERHDLVIDARGSVRRQLIGRNGIEIDGPEDVQRAAEQEHACSDGQRRNEQCLAAAPGDVDGCREEHEGQDREPMRSRIQRAEPPLRLGEIVGLEHGELRVHYRKVGRPGEARRDESLLHCLDENSEVNAHGVAGDLHLVGVLAGENRDELGMRVPVGLDPRLLELR
jgi:hypothetical protein